MGLRKKVYTNIQPRPRSVLLQQAEKELETRRNELLRAQVAIGSFDPAVLTPEDIRSIDDKNSFTAILKSFYEWVDAKEEESKQGADKTALVKCMMAFMTHAFFEELKRDRRKKFPQAIEKVLTLFGAHSDE
jgi:hypothetical protein